jgi:transcription elongation factor GreA
MVDELRRSRPIDATLLHEGVVTIGTQVRVRDVSSSSERTFTFLGPWDADLEKSRLDYRAPLARAFMGHEVGSTVRAELGGRTSQFELLEIRPAIG